MDAQKDSSVRDARSVAYRSETGRKLISSQLDTDHVLCPDPFSADPQPLVERLLVAVERISIGETEDGLGYSVDPVGLTPALRDDCSGADSDDEPECRFCPIDLAVNNRLEAFSRPPLGPPPS